MWQDQIQGMGVGGAFAALLRLPNAGLEGKNRGLGKGGVCRGEKSGGNDLDGDVGPERFRRLDGWRGVRSGLAVAIGTTSAT